MHNNPSLYCLTAEPSLQLLDPFRIPKRSPFFSLYIFSLSSAQLWPVPALCCLLPLTRLVVVSAWTIVLFIFNIAMMLILLSMDCLFGSVSLAFKSCVEGKGGAKQEREWARQGLIFVVSALPPTRRRSMQMGYVGGFFVNIGSLQINCQTDVVKLFASVESNAAASA
jgi:hypothetical protein